MMPQGGIDLSALKHRAEVNPKRKYREKFQALCMFQGRGMAVTDLLDNYNDAVAAAKANGPDAFEIKKLFVADDLGHADEMMVSDGD